MLTGTLRTAWLSLLLLLLGSLTGGLAGCGGGGEAGASDRPLTKAEFVRQAEAICQKGVKRKELAVIKGLERGFPLKTASQAELGQFVEGNVIGPFSQLITQLGSLRPPKGDQAAVKIVRTYESGLKQAEADPAKAVAHNPFVKADEAARAYGIKACVL